MHRALLLFLVLLTATSPAVADWQKAWPQLSLRGSGEFTWFGLPLYRASLWSREPGDPFSQPFALELTYHRHIPAERLVSTSLNEIQRLTGKELPPALTARWQTEMRQAFADVTPGQRITGVFLPGKGCEFYLDGQRRHVIKDPAFARLFFSIWLGPDTREPELRQALLGDQQP